MSNLPGTSPYRPNLGAAVEITQSMSVALPAAHGVRYCRCKARMGSYAHPSGQGLTSGDGTPRGALVRLGRLAFGLL